MKQGILLAAGFSRRFGSNKLLQPLADGVPVALAAARRMRAALSEVQVVVNPQDSSLAALLDGEGFRVIVCPQAHEGMGASLAWAVSQTPQASAWIIALADMPFIQPATIAQVADAIRRPEALVVPVFREQRGHPVGFGQAYLEELVALTGDEGARSILHRHVEQVQWLVCDDPGVIKDIDTPADLRPMAP